jgi:hypothetical protein
MSRVFIKVLLNFAGEPMSMSLAEGAHGLSFCLERPDAVKRTCSAVCVDGSTPN